MKTSPVTTACPEFGLVYVPGLADNILPFYTLSITATPQAWFILWVKFTGRTCDVDIE